MNPYTTNTVDSPSYKRLFCGRVNELSQLFDTLARGQSVALFGERRIGKSMLLFVLRDILNGDISTYENDLIDATLKASLDTLRHKLTHCTPVFISLQDFAGDNPTILGKFFLARLRTHGFLRPPSLPTVFVPRANRGIHLYESLPTGQSVQSLLNTMPYGICINGLSSAGGSG